MAQIHWTSAISADFNGVTFWSTGTIPGPADDAILDAVGLAAPVDYTVTSPVSETVLSIQTNIYATLDITGGAFDATAGTNGGVNAGSILVENNTSFDVGGTFDNTGLVSMLAGNNATSLVVAAAGASLTGAGQVVLDNDTNNAITGASAGATLTNIDNAVSGAGQIGAGRLILVNDAAGIIEATGTNALTLDTGASTDTNDGIMAAVNGALVLQNFTVDQSGGGTILAESGEVVSLQGAELIGGVLQTAGSGAIQTQGGIDLLDGATSTVSNQGLIEILNNSALEIGGAIDNTGTVELLAGDNATELAVTANAAISGAGQITLDDDGDNIVTAAATGVSLTNVDNVISGAGQLGDGQLLFVNDSGGTVEATGDTSLVVNFAAQTAVNDGLFEGEGAGGLILETSTLDDSGGGSVIAVSGGYVGLRSADILGGLVDGEAGGVVETLDGGSRLDGTAGHTVTVLGQLTVVNNTGLTVIGAVDLGKTVNGVALSGTITLGASDNATDLSAGQANATVIGGAILLVDDANNEITGVVTQGPSGPTAVSTLTNRSFISGAGTIGTNLRLVNDTTIEADGANALIIATGNAAVAGGDIVTNNGLLESANPSSLSDPGGLELDGGVIANTLGKGVIEASGTATHVDLRSVTIEGGTLETAGGGAIQTVDAGSVLDGATASVTNDGQVHVLNNTALTLVGSLDNIGQLDMQAGDNGADLKIGAAGATLSGGGQLTLSDSGNNRLYDGVAGVVLTNVDNTISGAGQLGAGSLGLVNEAKGVIDADDSTALVLNAGAASVANDGLIEATGSGGLTIQSSTIDDSKGGILEAAAGSVINLADAHIVGGRLETVGSGAIETADASSLLDGTASAVTLRGQVNILNNEALSLAGAIENLGTISVLGGNNGTDLDIAGAGVSLTGGGQIVLSNSGNNRLYSSVAGSILTNVDDTISGAGQLGAGDLDLINDAAGVIDADDATALVLNVGATSVANFGLIEATGSGGLTIAASTVDDSKGGVLLAADASVINLANAHIVGGEMETAGTGVFETADSNSVLDGATSAVTLSGQVNILNNEALTLAGTLDNLGTISVLAGNNGTDLFADNATLTGKGQILLGDDGNNIIVGVAAASRLVNVNDTISGAGQLGGGGMVLINQKAGKIEGVGADALVINTGANSVANSGLIEAMGTGGVAIQTTLDDSKGGVVEAANGSQIDLQNADLVGGTLETVGSGVFQAEGGTNLLDGSTATVENLGSIVILNNCALEITGTIDDAGSIDIDAGDNGTLLQINTAASLTGGGQVTLADGNGMIRGNSPAAVLTNVDDVISGAGQIGAGDLTLVNDTAGIINASGASALLVDASGTVDNDGLIEATGTGGLTIASIVNDADGGEILAAAGSTVTLQSGAIRGGTLARTGTGRFVTTGGTSLIDGSATAVTNEAEIDIANNTALEFAGTIDNTGTIAVQAGNNGTELLVDAASVFLAGAGQVTLADDPNSRIAGATAADTLVNVGNTISGAGEIGSGSMSLINRKAGVIDGDGVNQLVIDTGVQTITNAGRIEATGSGGVVIDSAVDDTGVLEVDGGSLTVSAAVTGAGSAVIHSGVITFDQTFAGSARFTGVSGTLALAQSQLYAGKVSGLSTHGTAGTDYIDLEDIAFVGVGEGTFKGTAAGGILTVGDGTHTATIALVGNYTRSGFVASSDGHGGTLITLGKRLPVAVADSYAVEPDQVLTETAATGVLANDVDPNGLTLSAVLAPKGGPAHGTLVLDADGAFTYTPDAGFKGPDSFTYIAKDADGSSAATTVSLIVGTGGPPVTQPDAYEDAAGQTLTVTAAKGVLANDEDLNGLPLTATLAPGEGPQHGVLHLDADGSFTYAPTLGFAGTDTFEYVAGDSLSAAPPTLVTITITAGAPTTKAETYADAAGHALTVTTANGVLAKDTDPNGLSLTAALAPGGGPAHGTLILNADGSFSYAPAAGFAGKDTFTYIASDSLASSAPTTVTLTVTATAPTSRSDSYYDPAGKVLAVTAANGVLANDTDANGLRLTAALAPGMGPEHGTLTLNANGSFIYTPNAGFAGTDTFDYIASDSLSSGQPTLVTLTVAASPPITHPETYEAVSNQVLTVDAANGVLANDSDPNGLKLTATLAPGGGPEYGTLKLNADGSFTYILNSGFGGFSGVDTFTYIAADGVAQSAPTTVTIDISNGATALAPTRAAVLSQYAAGLGREGAGVGSSPHAAFTPAQAPLFAPASRAAVS